MKKFTKSFSELSAEEFCKDLLIRQLRAKHVVVGQDAAVGNNREGTPERLKEILNSFGCELKVVDFVKEGSDSKISSRAIRSYIENGDMKLVSDQLGRYYSIDGTVISGKGMGKQIGYPTANICLRDEVVPCYGIYAARVFLNGKWYRAATNVGVSPTFTARSERVESYLIDYDGPDFYGERIIVELVEYVREEKQFQEIGDLIAQIDQDVRRIESILPA